MTDDHSNELDLVGCPQCAAPAEVVDRFARAEHARAGGARQGAVPAPALVPAARGLAGAGAHGEPDGENGAGPMTGNLSHRDRAILRAVAGGTAELLGSTQPDLFLDGRCCSDQLAARRLAHAGLIAGARPADTRPAGPGRLTEAGHLELLAV